MTHKKKDIRFKDLDGGAAFAMPLTLMRHPNVTLLTPYAIKLIFDLGKQYTGYNNGYLCASWSLMQGEGWRSSFTLHKATLEAEYYGLIKRTRQGGLNSANLHAFTWRRIDAKPDKPLSIGPTTTPSNEWKEPRVRFVYEQRVRVLPHRLQHGKVAA